MVCGTADWGHFRPDVAGRYPGDGRSFTGFNYRFDTRAVADGPHTIEIAAADSRGRALIFGRRSVVVCNTTHHG